MVDCYRRPSTYRIFYLLIAFAFTILSSTSAALAGNDAEPTPQLPEIQTHEIELDLIEVRVSTPAPNKKHIIIVFDWDDTLFPSFYLGLFNSNNLINFVINEDMERKLHMFEISLIDLLNTALSIGDVFIVTNAETGWVEMSAAKALPNVVPLLRSITIVSARSDHESEFPDDRYAWKRTAFGNVNSLLRKRLSQRTIWEPSYHLLSFGDADYERQATLQFVGEPGLFAKFVRFEPKSSINRLRCQIESITQNLPSFTTLRDNMDVALKATIDPPVARGCSVQ